MNRHPRPEVVSALVATLGLLLTSCSGSSPGGRADHPHPVGEEAAVAPGTHRISFLAKPGVETPQALVEVPSGFEDGDDWYVVSHDGDAFLGLSMVGRVQRDACLRPLHDGAAPGPSVEDLAAALVAQKSTRASVPKPVTLAGSRGLYVELAGPHDLRACDADPGLWDGRGIYKDDQVDEVWILDVDGQRLVVDAAYGPTSTASERDQLTSMVESLQFVAATSG